MSQKRAREVDDELAAVRCELKRERAAARAAAREWALPIAARRSILVMFDQAQGDVEPAVTYLHFVARERHWPANSDEELRGVVEEIFLDATSSADALESYASLVDTAAPSDPDAMRVALRYTEEWRVVVWAREQNTQKGLAPSTTQLLHSHEAHAALLPEAVRPPTHSARTSSASRKWGVRLRRRWGAEFGRIKVRERVPLNVMRDKATAAWQWWNYLETRTPPGTSLLRINLDETAVCLHQGGRSGNIFVTKQSRAGLVESATLGQRRTYLTHVAFICDRTDLQPRLPQILIGNEATLPLHALPALRAMCPPNVFLIRQKSSWNNNTLCANIIGRLKRALAPHAAGCQLVLILDTVKLHSADAVLHACRRWDVWPLFCPAKLTWLLQPLDTHAFGLYKHVLGAAYQRAQARAADGRVAIAEFLPCVFAAIRVALQGRRWGGAFDSNGFGQLQAQVAPRVLMQLELDNVGHVPSAQPTEEQLRLCFPRRSRVRSALVWRPVLGPPAARAKASPAAAAKAAPALAKAAPAAAGYGRTRSGALYKPPALAP